MKNVFNSVVRSSLVLGLVVLIFGCYSDCLYGDERTSAPNIILIMTDDQGYAPVTALGHPWILTPNLDRLHKESTRITRFLVSPTCSPTRSALMTGRHPMRNGITHTILERERMTLDAVTLPQILKKQGYKTAIFGKWHLGDESAYQPNKRGFDHVLIHGAGGIGQKYDCSCADVPGNKYFDPILRENGVFVKTKGYCTDLFFDGAIEWISERTKAHEPFFAYVATNAPHAPFHSPDTNSKRFKDFGFANGTAGFFGMIENIDENVGRLLAHIDSLGITKDTIVIFMSDNGMSGTGVGIEQEFAPGYKNTNAGMKGLKGTVDEGGVRVPFFIRWPGRIPADTDRGIVAAHIDLLPTLAEITGGEVPAEQVDGRSFWKNLLDSKTQWPDRFLVTHTGRWPTGANPDDFQWINFAIRSEKYRYIGPTGGLENAGRNRGELFDMSADPGQTNDVSSTHPDLIKEMEDFYDSWWKETRPLMVNEDAPMSATSPYWTEFEEQKNRMGLPSWRSLDLDE